MTAPRSDGRAQVLAQIRQSLGRSGPAPEPITALPGRGPCPAFEGDVVERFVAKMLEKSATVEPLASLAEVGAAVARFIAAVPAAPRVRVSGALAGIDWPPELLAAPIRLGLKPSCSAATFCMPPNSTLLAVSLPVMATPIQPISVPKNG